MGLVKRMWMEQEEQKYFEAKVEWIRNQLGDNEADEFTDGWDELEAEYESDDSAEESYDIYADEDDWMISGKSRVQVFDENIRASREFLQFSLSASMSKCLLVMLHAHIVTAVEAYLSSTFIQKVLSAEVYMRHLVENDPEFAKRTFTINELFNKREGLKNEIELYLRNLIFHNISKIKPMYDSVLNIDFGEIPWLYKAVALRHHCVHRAGFDKKGNAVIITKTSIETLIDKSTTLVHDIEQSMLKLQDNGDSFWKK